MTHSSPAAVLPSLAAPSTARTAVAGPRRIGHISLGLTTGGLERLLVDFARFHDRSQYELEFIALKTVGRPAEEIQEAGCPVHLLTATGRGRINRIGQLAGLLRERKFDVIHTHNAAPHWLGTLAARWSKVPVVLNTRHGQRFNQSFKDRWQFWGAALLADRLVAVSDDAARLSIATDHVPARKVTRIWNGIDATRFAYRGPTFRPSVISVARLSPEKDFPTLLRAVATASRVIPDLTLTIVGDGPERRALEALRIDLQLQNRVQFLGERRDVPELLAQAGFFVTASLTEGISLTLLESLAVGIPVLATSVGGNPEIVEEGYSGMLVPPGDVDALAAGLVRMCRHREEWPEMGRRGRERIISRFDIRQMVRNYEALYEELLAQAPRSRPH